MLLTARSDGANLVFSFTDLLETSLNRLVNRVDPGSGILFHMPIGQPGDQIVILLRCRQNSTCLEITDDGRSALRAAIDADVKHRNEETATNQARLTNPKIRVRRILLCLNGCPDSCVAV